MPVSRRSFLGGGLAAAAVAVTGTPLLAGCASDKKNTAAANSAVKLPTYTKYGEIKPDLPGTDVVLDGFLKYPANPVKAIAEAPGDGKPITFMTNIPGAIPPSVDKNQFWQELNKRLGSEMQISMASNDEYNDKFATRIAGGDLPDILNMPPGTPQIPGLLKAKAMDLTEHLSGDAVSKYPFLANIPSEFWKGCVFNGAIYGVPVPRGMSRTSLPLYRTDLLAAKGIKDLAPKNFKEFFDICKEMTAAKENRWAWTRVPTSYIRMMLGLPNNWKEEGGKFTRCTRWTATRTRSRRPASWWPRVSSTRTRSVPRQPPASSGSTVARQPSTTTASWPGTSTTPTTPRATRSASTCSTYRASAVVTARCGWVRR